MTTPQSGWRDLFTEGGLTTYVFIGGVTLQALEAFIATAMLPTVIKDIGGLDLFAWNTTLFVVASILASLFSTVRPRSIGLRAAYLIAAGAFALGSLICGLAPSMLVLLAGRAVQGFGAGLTIATTLAMLRVVFPQHLWGRAMALNAAIWGIATLLGPAVGGVFAELNIWRWAFLGIVPAAVLLALGAMRVLPAHSTPSESRPLPLLQLILVVAAILSVSIASVVTQFTDLAVGLLALGGLAIVLLAIADTRLRAQLLPAGTFSPRSPLSALFATIFIFGLTITSDIFAPLFLQHLHSLSPLWAGYMTALVAAGWSISAITTSGWTGPRVRLVITLAPIVMLVATLGFLVSLARPAGSADLPLLTLAALSLLGLGVGIGMAFQHLSTRVLATATDADNSQVSGALGTVQLFASGLGAAIGGVVVNANGLADATAPADFIGPAGALFVVFAAIAVLGIPLAWRVAQTDSPAAAPQPAE